MQHGGGHAGYASHPGHTSVMRTGPIMCLSYPVYGISDLPGVHNNMIPQPVRSWVVWGNRIVLVTNRRSRPLGYGSVFCKRCVDLDGLCGPPKHVERHMFSYPVYLYTCGTEPWTSSPCKIRGDNHLVLFQDNDGYACMAIHMSSDYVYML